jgi:transposase-like protein
MTMSQGRSESEDLSGFCCQNEQCPDYGRRAHGNLSVCMRYGKQRRRLLYCKTCKARFSERKGTPLFDSRLTEDKVVAVLAHLAEGVGVRKTGRLVGVSKDTVVRYAVRAGEHAHQLHDELVAFSPRHARSAVR